MTDRSIVLVWENFGPTHVDRCESVAKLIGTSRRVYGLELASASIIYKWRPETGSGFQKITLFHETTADVPIIRFTKALLMACWRLRPADFFFCHYSLLPIFLTAMSLRLSGSRVFAMNDSKFDDYRRDFRREIIKTVFYRPYNGAIASGTRAADYLRFLGIPESRVMLNYDTLSVGRIRRLAGIDKAPGGAPFEARHFTIVARMVPEKNISMALEAYSIYRTQSTRPRELHLCGSGPLEARLRAKTAELAIDDFIKFHGFLQTEDVCSILGTTLALLLPSTIEPFGLIVIEALAMGVPVILSESCGARDLLVRNGVNGFIVEPDNSAGLAFFMSLIDKDESLWHRLSLATEKFAVAGDASLFAQSVMNLTGPEKSASYRI
jgi:L-malate glycosyltransferase